MDDPTPLVALFSCCLFDEGWSSLLEAMIQISSRLCGLIS